MFVSSRTNLHTCTLPLAGSRSPLVKYARGSHIGFSSTSQTRSCALRMPRYVTFTKDSLLRSQIPTWALTLACTSNQFRHSWRSGSKHAPRMRMGPSLQQKVLGRVSLPVQAPSRKPSLLSKLTLASAIRSYSATAVFTTSMNFRQDTKTVISSVNVETLVVRGPAKGIPRRAEFVPSTGAPRRGRREGETRGCSARPIALLRTPLNAFRLPAHHCLRVVVHHTNLSAELRFESGSLQNRRQKTMVNPIESLGLI